MMKRLIREEVKALYARQISSRSSIYTLCGLSQMWEYLMGIVSDEAIRVFVLTAGCQADYRLRSWDNLTWLDSENIEQALNCIKYDISDGFSCIMYRCGKCIPERSALQFGLSSS